jgi:hypothetical protein
MNPNHGPSIDPSREKRLLAALRKQPQLFERIEAIAALSEAQHPDSLTADQVEELLVEELRKLGNQTMEHWAVETEERLAQQLQAATSGARLRKKNS